MKAIGYTGGKPLSDSSAFVELESETPAPTGQDLLVRIEAISVNPIDTKIRARTTEPQTPPKVLGWDAAGVVEAVGDDVTLFMPGDKVFYAGDVTRPGSNANYQLVDQRLVGRHPEALNFTEAAALPLTGITAWEALFERMRISPEQDKGKSVLIIGGAGGVGSIAIQLARQVAGLEVIATASRPESRDWCFNMGAHYVVDHRSDLPSEFRQQRIDSPDYILCCNSPDQHFNAMAELIAPQGVICSIVDLLEPHDLNVLKPKSAGFVWEFMFTRPMFGTPDMIKHHDILNSLSDQVTAGTLKTTMTNNLGPISVESLGDAHRLIERGSTIGKIVLEGFA